eukprot:scaffold2450_cov128-Isochrysis_galbana.AAC.2
MEFPRELTSASADEVAKSWEQFRLTFIRCIESALVIGCSSMDIFKSFITSTAKDGTGNPRLKAYLLDLVEDFTLGRNSPLACDVLLRKCDHSFSNGAAGYSQESASIAWDQMFERQEGMDVMEVARALTRAYVQKQGDQAIDVRTVWNHTHMAHEINDRMIIVLTRDQASKERKNEVLTMP